MQQMQAHVERLQRASFDHIEQVDLSATVST